MILLRVLHIDKDSTKKENRDLRDAFHFFSILFEQKKIFLTKRYVNASRMDFPMQSLKGWVSTQITGWTFRPTLHWQEHMLMTWAKSLDFGLTQWGDMCYGYSEGVILDMEAIM